LLDFVQILVHLLAHTGGQIFPRVLDTRDYSLEIRRGTSSLRIGASQSLSEFPLTQPHRQEAGARYTKCADQSRDISRCSVRFARQGKCVFRPGNNDYVAIVVAVRLSIIITVRGQGVRYLVPVDIDWDRRARVGVCALLGLDDWPERIRQPHSLAPGHCSAQQDKHT
jgi:hypothetical protein